MVIFFEYSSCKLSKLAQLTTVFMLCVCIYLNCWISKFSHIRVFLLLDFPLISLQKASWEQEHFIKNIEGYVKIEQPNFNFIACMFVRKTNMELIRITKKNERNLYFFTQLLEFGMCVQG